MSQFTNYGENKLADMVRGQGLTLPTSWRIAPLSAASDASQTELTGSGLARFTMTRNLTNWAGTQSSGSVLASSGTSHRTSNNVLINMGTATSAIGTVTHVGFFDQASGGNCWIIAALNTPIVTANGVAVQIDIDGLAFTLGLSGGMSDYLSNKLIDLIFRGQAYTFPSSMWLAAMTATPTSAGGGTEVGGGVGYSREEIPSTLTDWSGTQAAGSTVASNGTAGRISNNNAIDYSAPTGTWGDVGWAALKDASSSGNLMWWGALNSPKSIGVGTPLSYAADTIGLTWA